MVVEFSKNSKLINFFRDLDAFIYDATVLEYLVAQDEECKLLTVGAWAAMTGYGAAFPRNSKHFMNFDRKVMDFSENGKNSLDIDLRFNTKTCFFSVYSFFFLGLLL